MTEKTNLAGDKPQNAGVNREHEVMTEVDLGIQLENKITNNDLDLK